MESNGAGVGCGIVFRTTEANKDICELVQARFWSLEHSVYIAHYFDVRVGSSIVMHVTLRYSGTWCWWMYRDTSASRWEENRDEIEAFVEQRLATGQARAPSEIREGWHLRVSMPLQVRLLFRYLDALELCTETSTAQSGNLFRMCQRSTVWTVGISSVSSRRDKVAQVEFTRGFIRISTTNRNVYGKTVYYVMKWNKMSRFAPKWWAYDNVERDVLRTARTMQCFAGQNSERDVLSLLNVRMLNWWPPFWSRERRTAIAIQRMDDCAV